MPYKIRRVERLTIVSVLEDVRCDGCEAELTPVFDKWTGTFPQAKDALLFTAIGYYGGYVDFISKSEDTQSVLFCKSCADKLIQIFPAVRDRLGLQ